MSKLKLIKLCLKKDKKAWAIFLNKYSRLIYWAIQKRLASIGYGYQQSDIEDIFQEIFLMLFETDKLNQLKDIQLLPGWLAMVACNKTTDYIRKKFHTKESLTFDFTEIADNSFQESLISQDSLSLIDKIIKDLPDKEKLIISLNIMEEKTHKEIANITSTSINTISTIIARTKEKIKNKLEEMKEISN